MTVYVVLGPGENLDSVYADEDAAREWADFKNHCRPSRRRAKRWTVVPKEVRA